MQYLVLGANGYLGSYIYNRMLEDGLEVVGTGHCRKGADSLIGFDVLNDSVSDITKCMTDREKIAIICIAQPNIDLCKVENELSRQINVTFTKKIIEILIQENFHVIYFSTDNVFDGTKGNYTEQDTPNAVNQYGKMKEDMELFLAEKHPEVCIFRLPKVLGVEKEKQNMLSDLESKLLDKNVRCIKGNIMSIVAKEDVYQACLISSRLKMHGIYNLSSGEVFSRKELTVKFFDLLGVYDKDIVELELGEFGFKEMRPLNIGLDNSKFKIETKHEFISFEMLVKQYLIQNNNKPDINNGIV